MRLAENLKRFFLAWLTTGVAVALCLWRGSALVDASHPATFLNLLRQRYGIPVALAVLWLWCEAVLLVLSPAGLLPTMRIPKGRVERGRWVRGA